MLGVDFFFLQTNFDYLTAIFDGFVFVIPTEFRYKSYGIFVLGMDFVFFRQVSTF